MPMICCRLQGKLSSYPCIDFVVYMCFIIVSHTSCDSTSRLLWNSILDVLISLGGDVILFDYNIVDLILSCDTFTKYTASCDDHMLFCCILHGGSVS